MRKIGLRNRSFKKITISDLKRLREIARNDQREFFKRYPKWAALYKSRQLCMALCQGAALHYIRGDIGIKDFDVYIFYAEHQTKRWYSKRIKSYDFGNQKFGRSSDKPNYIGRRVDILGRSLFAVPETEPILALQKYIIEGKTKTARMLAKKAVVVLDPKKQIGRIIWPIKCKESHAKKRNKRGK